MRGYPQSSGVVEKNVDGVLGAYKSDGVLLHTLENSDTLGTASLRRVVRNIRTRFTIAQINAGATLLEAVPGQKIRMVAATAIAIGGAAGAVTTVDILATKATVSSKLVAFAQASLTQSAELKSGGTGAAILADGASYTANDTNTAITVNKTGASVTTATHIDINMDYVLEV